MSTNLCNDDIRKLTFEEFTMYCNDKICELADEMSTTDYNKIMDSDLIGLICLINIRDYINDIKVYRIKRLKLFLNKKATIQNREDEWKKIIFRE